MLNYIRSELYRTFHRKYTWIILSAGAGAALLANILFVLMQAGGPLVEQVTAKELIPLSMGPASVFAYISICILTDCVFSDEYKSQTLKNTVSYGITRTTVYFGKLAVEFLLALLAMVVIFGVFVLSCCLMMGVGTPAEMLEAFRLFGMKLLQAFPIWLAGLAIANLFYFTFRGTAAALGYLAVILAVPMIIMEFLSRAFSWAAELIPYLMFTHIGSLPTTSSFQLDIPWIMGPAWAAAAVFLGFLLFCRREIK